MAISETNQELLDLEKAREAVRVEANEIIQKKIRKADAVRTATNTLVFNKGNLPVDQRNITTEEIVSFAAALIAYIEA